jgi:hypothetical protein
MDNGKTNITLTKDDIPVEDTTVEVEKVTLSREWSFWETYEQKTKSSSTGWGGSIKKIFSFKDIIAFWQFWNYYPGSNFSEVFYNGEKIK